MLELLTPSLRVDGEIVASTTPVPAPVARIGDWLSRWAAERPDATFLAERDVGGWTRVTYREAHAEVERLARGLDRGPIMILSENSIAHALLMLAAMRAGVVVSAVSPAYSLQSTTFGRLREVAALLAPAYVWADSPRYDAAIAALGIPRLAPSGDHAPRDQPIAKILFTSGSTGRPKGVVNTHAMLTSNQESLAACWPFLARMPPVIVDWLPWSHTFGANHNFNLVLRNGGSLYIDEGRPAPALVAKTVVNLADVQPNIWFNVPRGFDQVVAILEHDLSFAARAFANLEVIFYAAAALAPTTRARLEAVAAKVGRNDIFFTSAWGSTETSPLATSAHFATPTTGNLGVPIPGVQLRMAPVQDRLEIRVKGPNVTPGYWNRGAIEPAPRDELGFLPTGDAGRFVDPARPEAGIVFAGRLGENFKLSSGTWVSVAQVRLALIDACQGLLVDAVICGHDREALGALLFPARAGLEDELRARIGSHNVANPSSSLRIAAVRVLDEPLSLDEGESTDKGYTNQRRVLERRAADVAALFNDPRHRLDSGA